MPQDFAVIGGSQIGWVNASWPFAKLAVSKEKLTLSCLGTYTFQPDQIAALEPHGAIPFFGRGVRIVHVRADYPAKMIFWCPGSPEKLIARIRGAGFSPTGTVAAMPPRNGIPVRWTAILVIIAIWNGLFLLDNPAPLKAHAQLGWPSLLAIGLLCATVWTLPQSQYLQSLVLKPGRSLGEIKPFVGLLRLVSTIMFTAFAIQLAFK